MSKEKQMTVEEYREKHKRCKTCEYAMNDSPFWKCRAKGKLFFGNLGESGLRGCFCKLYKARYLG